MFSFPQMTRWYKTPTKILFCLSQEGATWVNFYWVCDASVADPDLQMGGGEKGWGAIIQTLQ